MSAPVHGIKTHSVLQAEQSGSVDRHGVDSITRVEEVPVLKFPELLLRPGTPHKRFRSMAVSKVSWARNPCGKFYRVTYLYEGYLLTLPEPTYYELSGALSEEPIQTHPDFITLAGTPAAPLHGAIFIDPDTQQKTSNNDKGVFREFKTILAGVTNKKAGVQGYLSPGATWTEISFSRQRPIDLGQLGKIDKPPGRPPSFSDNRNWLYYDVSYRQRGSIYEIRKTWKLSARGGWDKDIY